MAKKRTRSTPSESVPSSPKPNRLATGVSRTHLYILVAVGLLTLVVFSNAFHNEFTIADDDIAIVNNPYIKDFSIGGFQKIFTTINLKQYRPLTYVSFSFIHRFFGLDPTAFFTSNLIFHLLNIFLVFVFLDLLAERKEVALVAAALFAVHPTRVEAVTWLAAHNEVLYSTFYLGALVCWVKYLKRSLEAKFLVFAFVLFVLSVLTKPVALVLPAVLLMLDWFHGRKLDKRALVEKIPFAVVSAAMMVVTYLSRSAGNEIGELTQTYSPLDRLFLASYSLAFYAVKFFLPFNLCSFYYLPDKTGGALPPEYYLSAFVVGAIAFGVWKAARKWPTRRTIIMFVTAFFLLNTVLVIQLVPFGLTVTADRYTYIPYVGPFLLVGTMVSATLRSEYPSARKIKPYFLFGLVACVSVFSVTARLRNEVWKNSLTVTADVIEHYPNKANGYNNRGIAKLHLKDYQGAWEDYDASVRLDPDQYAGRRGRGTANFHLQRHQEALNDYNKSLELFPNDETALYNRGLVKNALQDYQGAVKDFDRALALNPKNPNMYLDRGNSKFNLKDFSGAETDFNTAVDLNPDYAMAYHNRGFARLSLGRKAEACADWIRASALGYAQAAAAIEQNCR